MGAYKQAVAFLRKGNGNRKAFIVTIPSILIDMFFAVFNFYIGFLNASLWYVMISFYYMLLLFLRIKVIMRAGRAVISRKMNQRMLKNHHKFGWSLLIMDIVMGFAMYMMLRARITKPFNMLLIVPVGLYTLYKISVAVINLFKAHKSQSTFAIEIRKICQADALISILMLESAIINRFGNLMDTFYYNISFYTGIVVCIIIALMAITSIRRETIAVDISVSDADEEDE
ncbi:hypothetical protein SAMN02910456_00284 [Ruminococcaceae bacterium YRB3002]|nr:hypothetical protein SAMN02910456_00284 [Ruminococcaceae bacterium YRB3002]